TVHGRDYPTPDGTCIRDYVHVEDLSDAHLLALPAPSPGEHRIYNLGNGTGFSVQEVVDAARQVTGHPIPTIDGPRRAGDPAKLVASSDLIRADLGWAPRHTDLAGIVQDAWGLKDPSAPQRSRARRPGPVQGTAPSSRGVGRTGSFLSPRRGSRWTAALGSS
uniref:NAD-dependent epimerase/dehydratase family protein n=1 Tax=Staphylococcus haemolyticus TaxID=1283 RepID=UPI0015D6B8A5